MSSDVVALCCCGAGLGDCCDFWNQCDIATPTTVTVTMEERITRNWSTGGSLVIAEAVQTWTATSWTRGQSEETVCDPEGEDNASTFYLRATSVVYDLESTYRYPIIANAQSYGSASCPPGPPQDCSGCDEDYGCREENPDPCEHFREEYGAASLTIPGYEARIVCVVEDGCVRPSIEFFRTAGGTATVTGGTFAFTPGCCNLDSPTSDAATYGFESWSLVGECGCLGPKSWLTVKPAPPSAFGPTWLAPLVSCGFPSGSSGTGTWTGDEQVETISWICSCDFVTPGGGSIYNECSMEVRWHDVCERTVTVSVA